MWNFPLFPEQASTTAQRVDQVFLLELAATFMFAVVIFLLLIGFAVRYRQGSRADRRQVHSKGPLLEISWIAGSVLVGLVLFVLGMNVYFEELDPPGNASRIDVVGKQWMWYLQHPEGKREINELHVPLGRPVRLRMISQDVIHSFFVPVFRIKSDVLPGRYSSAWFQPTRIGKFNLFCAEYCGTNHSGMVGSVYVMDPADYERWLAGADAGVSMARAGQELFVRHHCAGCHGDSPTVKAPRLEGVYGRPVPIMEGKEVRFVTADDRYIRDSILLPKAQVVAGYEPVMPSFAGQINEEDLLKIIEYIKAIGPGGSER